MRLVFWIAIVALAATSAATAAPTPTAAPDDQPAGTAEPALRPPSVAEPVVQPPGATESMTVPEWAPAYRWQIAAADLTSISLMALAFHARPSNASAAATASLITYIAVNPIIHLSHQELNRMLVSLALRLGAPFLLAPALVDRPEHELFGPIAAGMVGVMLIDSLLIAPDGRTRWVRPASSVVTPNVVARPGYLGVGLGGRF